MISTAKQKKLIVTVLKPPHCSSDYTSPTVQKIFIHGPGIVSHALMPNGQLSNEAGEMCNKEYKAYRDRFSKKKTFKIDNLRDVFNRLLISSAPVITDLRKLRTLKRKSFD